ncbi:Uncharacterised protein [Serratia marcescens]|uniref:Uncharacterized protein n=1 Tax=Serratia marcescens TaxID=615 RepID=A0A380AQS8_SERMA|nr:Uncharacterised protein [Serratia marcescens]
MDTSRPCSIQVYQVALMPLICASSSRRRPLVRRREELGQAEHFRRDAFAVRPQERAEGLWPG